MKEFALGTIFGFLVTFFAMWFLMQPKKPKEPDYILNTEIAIAQTAVFGPNNEVTALIYDEENFNKLLHNLEKWGIEYKYEIRTIPH